MNIKQIVDKIPKEADINPAEYTVADRISDVNSQYLQLIEKARQIGSIEPISGVETFTESFAIVAGANTLTRTIKDIPIERIDYKPTGASKFRRVNRDISRSLNTWQCLGMKFFANEKQIFIENGLAGDIRVTYIGGNVTTFTESDYNAGTPPTPTFLPEVFHDLLWLHPALTQAQYYKTDRVNGLTDKVTKLQNLFDNRYGRNAVQTSRFQTGDDYCCDYEDNYR